MNLYHRESIQESSVFASPEQGGAFGGLFRRIRGRTSNVVQQPTIPRLNNHLLTLLSHNDLRFDALLQARRDVDPDVQERHVRSTLETLLNVKSVAFDPTTQTYSITDQGRGALSKMAQK